MLAALALHADAGHAYEAPVVVVDVEQQLADLACRTSASVSMAHLPCGPAAQSDAHPNRAGMSRHATQRDKETEETLKNEPLRTALAVGDL